MTQVITQSLITHRFQGPRNDVKMGLWVIESFDGHSSNRIADSGQEPRLKAKSGASQSHL